MARRGQASTTAGAFGRLTGAWNRRDWAEFATLGAAIALLHAVGFGALFILVAPNHYHIGAHVFGVGLGVTAYTFGLRHAFDADHIAAIDNTTRKLLQQGKRPLGVGFFFSLGHSTIVFGLAGALAVAAATVNAHIPSFQH